MDPKRTDSSSTTPEDYRTKALQLFFDCCVLVSRYYGPCPELFEQYQSSPSLVLRNACETTKAFLEDTKFKLSDSRPSLKVNNLTLALGVVLQLCEMRAQADSSGLVYVTVFNAYHELLRTAEALLNVIVPNLKVDGCDLEVQVFALLDAAIKDVSTAIKQLGIGAKVYLTDRLNLIPSLNEAQQISRLVERTFNVTNMSMKKCKPAKGCRDILSSEMRVRQIVIGEVEKLFKLFGGQAIDTPVMERKEI